MSHDVCSIMEKYIKEVAFKINNFFILHPLLVVHLTL